MACHVHASLQWKSLNSELSHPGGLTHPATPPYLDSDRAFFHPGACSSPSCPYKSNAHGNVQGRFILKKEKEPFALHSFHFKPQEAYLGKGVIFEATQGMSWDEIKPCSLSYCHA